jgi:hypothetical protein
VSATPGAGPFFSAELLEQLKEQLPAALFASLSGTVATTVATYEEQLGAASKQLDTTRSELPKTGAFWSFKGGREAVLTRVRRVL